MNELNYASFEASKRLVDAGVVLEMDAIWSLFYNGWRLVLRTELHPLVEDYPAPSMTEVLEELPNNTAFLKNKIYYASTGGKDNAYKEFISTNPTDALIDLLIWTRKEKV